MMTDRVGIVTGMTAKIFFNNVYSHEEKKIQCRYESPREEAREEHG
jgi:hypothetical protein